VTPRRFRTLAALLAAQVALGGALLDLCGCGEGGHGALCASEPAAPRCHAEVAPAAPSCCASDAPADAATPRIGAADCACPLLVLEAPDAQPDDAAPPTLPPARPAPDPSAATPVAARSAPALGSGGGARAPPGPRRHLLLACFRC